MMGDPGLTEPEAQLPGPDGWPAGVGTDLFVLQVFLALLHSRLLTLPRNGSRQNASHSGG